MAGVPALRIAALTKRYRKLEALSRIELELAPGEAFGLVGANGAGKTTLIKCILDLTSCDAGTIEIFGIAAEKPAARRRLAYLPERFNPPHYLRAREFLAMMLELAGERYDASHVQGICDELELEREALEQPVRNLSKGMTQKLGLAGCFVVPRELYVLDEPMSGLDPAARVAVKVGAAAPRRRGQDALLHFARARRRRRAVRLDRGARARPGALPGSARGAMRALRRFQPGARFHEMHP